MAVSDHLAGGTYIRPARETLTTDGASLHDFRYQTPANDGSIICTYLYIYIYIHVCIYTCVYKAMQDLGHQ